MGAQGRRVARPRQRQAVLSPKPRCGRIQIGRRDDDMVRSPPQCGATRGTTPHCGYTDQTNHKTLRRTSARGTASVWWVNSETLAPDDEQALRDSVSLLSQSRARSCAIAGGSGGRRMGGRPPRGRGACWLSRATRSPQCDVAGKAGREVVTGTIGARRAWTVSMISALSMPCR
jgi:hypothetical protein